MQKLVTNTGKEFAINWCGPSTIDFALRFGVPDGNMLEILQVFMNPEETQVLKHHFDNQITTFNGYTAFKGVDLKVDGEIVVALNQKQGETT